MIDLISVANMRDSDRETISSGVAGITLMERAARGIYDSYGQWDKVSSAGIITGSGNNGGDGFALALILEEKGIPVTILTMSERTTEDAGYYKQKCLGRNINMVPFTEIADLDGMDVIVDSMLGTGFTGTPRDNYRDAIEAVNAARERGAYVISADINSGMNGDTGEFEICVTSDLTVAIGYLKKGQITPGALSRTHALTVADIGIRLLGKEEVIDESLYGIRRLVIC